LTATEIQARFGISSALRFEDTPGGLVRAIITGPQADATVYLHGAHITSWTPTGQQPMLFTSSRSRFEPGMAIRGGVPIVFPWFGPRSDGVSGPLHGFARIVEWSLESARQRPDGAVELSLALAPNEVSRALGYDSFHVRFRVALGAALEMEMEVHNQSEAPFRFEEAFHTYLAVGDIRRVSVTGLGDTTYVDKTAAFMRKQAERLIRITRETDQVHLNTAARCEIDDPVWRRVIVVEKEGSDTTVVWNPWIEKTRTIADMAPDDWQGMLCLETANALDNAVVLPAGGVHRMRTTIRIRS
jgi:glucose-6-phosphate 1-epimerase